MVSELSAGLFLSANTALSFVSGSKNASDSNDKYNHVNEHHE